MVRFAVDEIIFKDHSKSSKVTLFDEGHTTVYYSSVLLS